MSTRATKRSRTAEPEVEQPQQGVVHTEKEKEKKEEEPNHVCVLVYSNTKIFAERFIVPFCEFEKIFGSIQDKKIKREMAALNEDQDQDKAEESVDVEPVPWTTEKILKKLTIINNCSWDDVIRTESQTCIRAYKQICRKVQRKYEEEDTEKKREVGQWKKYKDGQHSKAHDLPISFPSDKLVTQLLLINQWYF
jgi:hypothetical protein